MTPVNTLKVKNKLALTPKSKPFWSKSIKSKNGEIVSLADPTATRGLVALMDMQAVMGGAASHFGGPSAFAEIMSVVHGLVFTQSKSENWFESFNLVNDAGHCENGIYALKANYGFADLKISDLKGFRSIKSPLTGHGESHLFPQGVYLSNGPLGSSIAQAQGLALADGLLKKDRTTIVTISDGACMEGEAKEAFAAIPGLARKNKLAPFLMIVSDNNTKLSGRIDEESFSMKPTFDSLQSLGWKVINLDDTHDLQKCWDVIESSLYEANNNPQIPVAVIAKTIKGYGTKLTSQSSSGGHGFPLSDPDKLEDFISEIYNGQTIPSELIDWTKELIQLKADKKNESSSSSFQNVKFEKIQKGVSKALIEKRSQGLPIFSVTSDLPGSTGVKEFQKAFADSWVDIGVAESNMVSVAAGLSKAGFIPVVDTFAQFGVTKGALPLTMASLSQAPMIAFFSHTGFQDAADGASHQALSWLSMVASIPNVQCIGLTSSEDAYQLVSQAIEQFVQIRNSDKVPPTTIFFLGRENFPETFGKSIKYQLGQAQTIYQSSELDPKKSVTLVAGGSMLLNAFEAIKDIEKQGYGVILINPSQLNLPDIETISSALNKTNNKLITIEDHQLIAGMGSILVHQLVLENIPISCESLAVKGEFGQSAYLASELYEKHNLDNKAILSAVKKLLN